MHTLAWIAVAAAGPVLGGPTAPLVLEGIRARHPVAVRVSHARTLPRAVVLSPPHMGGRAPEYFEVVELTVEAALWDEVRSPTLLVFHRDLEDWPTTALTMGTAEALIVVGAPFDLAGRGGRTGSTDAPVHATDALTVLSRGVWRVHEGVVQAQNGEPACVEARPDGLHEVVACHPLSTQSVDDFLDRLQRIRPDPSPDGSVEATWAAALPGHVLWEEQVRALLADAERQWGPRQTDPSAGDLALHGVARELGVSWARLRDAQLAQAGHDPSPLKDALAHLVTALWRKARPAEVLAAAARAEPACAAAISSADPDVQRHARDCVDRLVILRDLAP